MDEKIICQKCGRSMTTFHERGSIGMKCPNCGWGWVTSMAALSYDPQKYHITIAPCAAPNVISIKAMSQACACNFLEAREKLLHGHTFTELSSADAAKISGTLKSGHIAFELMPEATNQRLNNNIEEQNPHEQN